MSISAVTSDASGRVIYWQEGSYTFKVQRDASGLPLLIRGTGPGKTVVGEFKYNGSTFTGVVGDIDSVMMPRLIAQAMGDAGGGTSVTVVDNLTTTDTASALSANQGKVLKDLVDTKTSVSVVNDLTTGGAAAALSAQQGVALGGRTVQPTTATFTANLTNNSAVLSSVSSFVNIAVGRVITGTGIESGAAVQSFNAGAGTVTLTKVCKGSSLTGLTCTVEIPGNTAGAATPDHPQGAVLTDSGFDLPNGYANLFNYRPSQVRKFLAARGAAIAGKFGGYNKTSIGGDGVYSSDILVYGDSKAVGNTPVSPNVPKRLHSPFNQVANVLNARGECNWFNNAFVSGYNQTGSAELAQFDGRVTFSDTAWAYDDLDTSMCPYLLNSTTTGSFTFTPAEPADSFDIVVRVSSTGAEQFSWAIDGGSATTVSVTSNAGKIATYNVSAGSVGAHSITIARVTGSVRIVAVIPRNSTVYGLNILNLARSGSSLNARLAKSSSATVGIPRHAAVFSPTLVIQQWGYTAIGDAADPLTSVATTIANYGTELDLWAAQGVPVLVVSPSPWDDVNLYKDKASQRDYLRALRAMCVAKNVPMVQMDERWGSWQEAVAAKFLTHYARPDPQGNADMGRTIARAIESM